MSRRFSDRLPTVRSLAEFEELVADPRELYLRYSLGPDQDIGGRSTDYESGLELPGLSVTVLEPEPWWTRPLRDWLARQLCKYVDLARSDENRRPWVLTGREVARGPDHEPLLLDVEPVAMVHDDVVTEARRVYQERFDVGRDSTD